MFKSFFQGGFECSTHRRDDGNRLDVIAATCHDAMAEADYRLLRSLGMRTIRDGLRWHLIDRGDGHYDWSSFLPMLQAARSARVEVIWDLMHYGWPDGLDIWSPQFVNRFAAFAGAVARMVRDQSDDVPWYVPVNEISFMAWAGGEMGIFNPATRGRGTELKQQLALAAIAAIEAVRAVDPRARFIHTDPAIHVFPIPRRPWTRTRAQELTHVQFQAWDMLSGRSYPELGGRADYLDVIGINYYPHNQWVFDGPPIDWQGTDPRYIPFRNLLHKIHRRYRRPMYIAETGIEADLRPAWFTYVSNEVFASMAEGVPIHGLCLYPVMNHPGWADDRHCPNGIIDYDPKTMRRWIEQPLAEALAQQQQHFAGLKLSA